MKWLRSIRRTVKAGVCRQLMRNLGAGGRATPPAFPVCSAARYRARSGAISWCYQLYRPEKVFEHAFDEACETAQAETDLPLFMGHPEA